ncbi:hypothetical protein WJX74_007218 [Apatococcus lobatus]|uniref:Telomerase reverse transcriptase n=1 Tax=Apatococcus lobatus TaxID=904363 RepID=A0AAW1SAT2_9CHLO
MITGEIAELEAQNVMLASHTALQTCYCIPSQDSSHGLCIRNAVSSQARRAAQHSARRPGVRCQARVEDQEGLQQLADALEASLDAGRREPRFKPFIAESEERKALLAFKHEVTTKRGLLSMRPIQEAWIPESTELLTDAFAESMGYRPAFRRYLVKEIKGYLHKHLNLPPKAIVIMGLLQQPADAAAASSVASSSSAGGEAGSKGSEAASASTPFSREQADQQPPAIEHSQRDTAQESASFAAEASAEHADAGVAPSLPDPQLVGTVELSFSASTRTQQLLLNPPRECAYLCNMAVTPDWRRQGYGMQLLRAAEMVAQLAGKQEIYLHVRHNDAPATGLYERGGYSIVKSDPKFFGWFGIDPKHLLKKDLSPFTSFCDKTFKMPFGIFSARSQNLAPAPQLQALIETTVVALDADVPPLRVASLHQQSTHQEVLKRAVEATLRSHHGACNILTHGYGKAGRGRASGGERKDVASTLLQGPAWGMLLACIGDTLMLYLLIHSSIFMQMANGCYLQITGQPINKVVQERRAAVPGGVLSRPPTRRQTSSRKAAASLSTSTTPTPRIAAAYQDVQHQGQTSFTGPQCPAAHLLKQQVGQASTDEPLQAAANGQLRASGALDASPFTQAESLSLLNDSALLEAAARPPLLDDASSSFLPGGFGCAKRLPAVCSNQDNSCSAEKGPAQQSQKETQRGHGHRQATLASALALSGRASHPSASAQGSQPAAECQDGKQSLAEPRKDAAEKKRQRRHEARLARLHRCRPPGWSANDPSPLQVLGSFRAASDDEAMLVQSGVDTGAGVGKSKTALRRAARSSSWHRRRAAVEAQAPEQHQSRPQQPPTGAYRLGNQPSSPRHGGPEAPGTGRNCAQQATCLHTACLHETASSPGTCRLAKGAASPPQHLIRAQAMQTALDGQPGLQVAHANRTAAPSDAGPGIERQRSVTKGACSMPKGWLGPHATIIPRGAIFHSASFPRKPGLPSHHILSILHKQRNARRTLYAHIFIQPLSMQREALKGRAQRPRPGQRAYRKLGLPAIPRRVPASQHRLEQRTLQMLGRARRLAEHDGCSSAGHPEALPSTANDEGQHAAVACSHAVASLPSNPPRDAGTNTPECAASQAAPWATSSEAAPAVNASARNTLNSNVMVVTQQAAAAVEEAAGALHGPEAEAGCEAISMDCSDEPPIASASDLELWDCSMQPATQDLLILATPSVSSGSECDMPIDCESLEHQADIISGIEATAEPARSIRGNGEQGLHRAHSQSFWPAGCNQDQLQQLQSTQSVIAGQSAVASASGTWHSFSAGSQRKQHTAFAEGLQGHVVGRSPCAQVHSNHDPHCKGSDADMLPARIQPEPQKTRHVEAALDGSQSLHGARPQPRSLPCQRSQHDHPGADAPLGGKQSSNGAHESMPYSCPQQPDQQQQQCHAPEDSHDDQHVDQASLPSIDRHPEGQTGPREDVQQQLVASSCSHAQVTGFIWSVLRHVVPQALLGDKPVRKQLRTSLTAFIALRRHEVMSVGQAMQGLSLSSIPAFCPDGCRGPANAAAKQQRMLALWIRWLFAELIVPLLRAQFYVTESEAHRQRVFYYRKPVWAALTAKATSGLLQGMYRRISDNETRCTLQDRQLGITRLRFVPKPMGLRPISMLGCTSSATLPVPRDVGERWGNSQPRRVRLAFKPINTILQNLYQVLKYEVARQPEALGSTVFGYNDAYARLKPFLQRWRSSAAAHHSLSPPSEQRPYLLSVDVTRAFDSIDTELMLAVVAPVLQCHEYLIFRYLEVLPNNGKVRVAPRRAARALDAGAGRHSFLTHAHALAETYHGRIYMDQGAHQTLKRSAALQLLSAHMRQNIVRLGKDWCRQRQGIPQGSVLSTLLCSLYLGHLEKVYLQPILQGTLRPLAEGVPTLPAGQDTSHQPAQEQGSSSAGLTDLATAAVQTSRTPSEGAYLLGSESQPDGNAQQATLATQSAASLLLRLVDDFLLITFCPAAAEAMAACLLKGFPSHNIYTNPAKTQLSFELNHASMRLSRKVHISADGSEWVKWCGLLVNTASLDIQADYLRYSKKPLSDALTLPLSQSAGMQLEQKLRQHLRPKCHPILLDTSLHSAFTVRLNIFQGFLLAAMKFHCHHSSLSQVGSADVIWRAMEGGWKHMVHLIGRRMTSCTRRDSIGSACNVPHHQTTWLGMKAFQHVMVQLVPAGLVGLDSQIRAMFSLPGPPQVLSFAHATEATPDFRLRKPKRSGTTRCTSTRRTRALSNPSGRGAQTVETAKPQHTITFEQAEQMAQEPFLSGVDERRASGNGAGPSHSAHSMPATQADKPAWFKGCRVQVRDVSKIFETRSGTNIAVDGVDLQLEPHSFTAFLGPSGSGKTTFMRLIAGLEAVTSGSIVLDGRDATDLPAKERQIGFVFQSYALFKHMTLAENISFGPRMQEMEIDINKRVEELLEVVELPGQGHKYPKQLSGGQKQRIALARALAANSKLLLMDEPFGALDPTIRASVRTTLAGIIKRVGVTSIMVTHDQEEAFDLADRVIIFNRGRIEQDGTPEEIMQQPNSPFVMHFTGDVNQMPADHQFAKQMGVKTDKPEVMFRPEDVELRTSTPRIDEEDKWCAATVNDGALTEGGYKFYLQLTPDTEVEFIRRHVDGEDGSGIFLASSQRVYIRVHPSCFMAYHPSELDSTPV